MTQRAFDTPDQAPRPGLRARLLGLYLRRVVRRRLAAQPGDPTAIDIARINMERTAARFTRGDAGCQFDALRASRVPIEIVATRQAPPEPAPRILYLHGGGFVMGSPRTHRQITTRLAALSGARVYVPDYRLAPEWPWPAGLEDCVAAYRFLLDNGTAASRIVVAGDSAGGNLVLSLLLFARRLGLPLPAAAVCLSPWTDLTLSGASLVANAADDALLPAELIADAARLYCPDAPLDVDTVSPLYGDYAGLPPLKFHVGDREILYDDAVGVHRRARAAGVDSTLTVYPGLPHVFHIFSGVLPEARAALRDIAGFVTRHAGAGRTEPTGRR